MPTAADEGPSVPTEPAAIDVEFQPIRRARERVAPAQIVSAESLRSETVTPVVWLRVANLDDAPASRSRSKPAPEIPRHGVATSWFKPALMHDEAADPGDLAAAVLVSLDSARRASYGGFDHAHRAGDCAFCRRAVAAYR